MKHAIGIAAVIGLGALPACCAAQQPCGQWVDLNHEIPGVGGQVFQMTMWDRDGAGPEQPWLVVVGSFDLAGDEDATQVAAWDGTRWRGLSTGNARNANRCVYAVGTYQGKLVVGGFITEWNGLPARHVLMYDGEAWTPIGGGPDGEVRCLREYQGKLIAGGPFGRIDPWGTNAFAPGVASWDGAAWSAMGDPGISVNSSLVEFQGSLYAAGNGVSRWSGSGWEVVLSGAKSVRAMVVRGGELIIGGTIANAMAGSTPSPHLIRYDGMSLLPLGSAWPIEGSGSHGTTLFVMNNQGTLSQWNGGALEPLSPGIEGSATSFQAAGDSMYVGGAFTTVGGVGVLNVARFDGTNWLPLGNGFNDGIESMTLWSGKLVVGGAFTRAGNANVNRLTVLDNGVWKPVGAGVNSSSASSVRNVSGAGSFLYAGGVFSKAGAGNAKNAARWSGSQWQALGTGVATDVVAGVALNNLYHVATNGDPTLDDSNVRRWLGNSWQQLGPTIPGVVNDLRTYNGQLIVGGGFRFIGTRTVNGVARWDGASWQALGGGMTATHGAQVVFGLGEFKGELVAGGWFDRDESGSFARSLVRFDGTKWRSVGGLPADVVYVYSFAEYRKQLFAATNIGVMAWDGATWRVFEDAPPSSPLFVFNDELYLSPGVVKFAGKWRPHLARWRGCAVCDGDLNSDRIVDDLDFQIFVTAYDVLACSDPGMAAGCLSDFNGDKVVDDLDFQGFVARYNDLICPQ